MNNINKQLLRHGVEQFNIQLNDTTLEKFGSLSDELISWNSKINLTAITKSDEITVKHFVDSLSIVKIIKRELSVLDVGSGAGFPSIPLALLRNDLKITSVDSVFKKIQFQKHIVRLLGINNLIPCHARVESLEEEKYDVIVSRAFSDLQNYVASVFKLVKSGGSILVMQSGEGKHQAIQHKNFFAESGLSLELLMDYKLPSGMGDRTIIELRKML